MDRSPSELPKVFNSKIAQEDIIILLEQYKLYVSSTNLTSELRNKANTYFISVSTLLIGLISALLNYHDKNIIPYWIIFTCIGGVILCMSWFLLLRSYRNLNSGRFKVINELEEKLPAKIYRREWEIILKTRGKRYVRLTQIEQVTPLVFIVLYGSIIASLFIL